MKSRRLLALAVLPALLLGCKEAEGSGTSASSVGDSSVSEPPALIVRTFDIPMIDWYGSIASDEIKSKEYKWFDFLPSKTRTYNFLIQFWKRAGYYDVVAEEFPEPFSGYGGVATAEHRKNYRFVDISTTEYFIAFSKQLSRGAHFYLRLRGENFWRTSYCLYLFDDLSNIGSYSEHLSHEYGSYFWKNYTSHRATCSECGHVDEQPHAVASGATPDRWGYYRCLLCGGRAKFGFIQEGAPAVVGVSENGSVELESDIKVVVDDDLGALRDGTLELRRVAQGGHDAE